MIPILQRLQVFESMLILWRYATDHVSALLASSTTK